MTASVSTIACKSARTISILAVLLLSACSANQILVASDKPPDEATLATIPMGEKIGNGGPVIGLIMADTPGNLSDGMANSAYLAGKLAVKSLKDTEVTLIIQRYERTPEALKKVATAFIAGHTSIIIGPNDNEGALALAKFMAGKNIPIISLGTAANPEIGVYAAGLSDRREAEAVSVEMKKLKYRTVIIAHTNAATSTSYAKALVTALSSSGIKATEHDVSDPVKGLEALLKPAEPGTARPNAIAFATGPLRAAKLISALRKNPRFAKVAMVGNSGWSTALKQIPHGDGIWYATLARSQLAGFAAKFAVAGHQTPTLRSAIVYDLVVMAGVLPKIVLKNPYATSVLTNPQGFNGQTGRFRFNTSGVAERSYVIVATN